MRKRYNTEAILQEAKQKREFGIAAELNQTKQELETLKMEHGFVKRQLSVHEKREKKRQDGLKKAQQARKKVK